MNREQAAQYWMDRRKFYHSEADKALASKVTLEPRRQSSARINPRGVMEEVNRRYLELLYYHKIIVPVGAEGNALDDLVELDNIIVMSVSNMTGVELKHEELRGMHYAFVKHFVLKKERTRMPRARTREQITAIVYRILEQEDNHG